MPVSHNVPTKIGNKIVMNLPHRKNITQQLEIRNIVGD